MKIDKHFYFVVSTEAYTEVGAHFAQQNGGAGYILQSNNGERIAFSVYLKSSEAEAVQASLDTYTETEIAVYAVETLYFRGRQRKNTQMIKGAFSSLYGVIEILINEIKNLDRGQTQEECKRILSMLEGQLEYLSQTYSDYEIFASVCQSAAQSLRATSSQTVFAKDLRYLACGLCVGYVHFANEFAL